MAKKKEAVEVVEVVDVANKDDYKSSAELVYQLKELEGCVESIKTNLGYSLDRFVDIGKDLKKIQDEKLYELSDYKTFFEFTNQVFGLSETVTRNYIAITKLDYQRRRELVDKGYKISQLIEMLPVIDDIDKFTPEMSIVEIRSQKSILKADEFEKKILFDLKNCSEDLIHKLRNPDFNIVTTFKPENKKKFERACLEVTVKGISEYVLKIERTSLYNKNEIFQVTTRLNDFHIYKSFEDMKTLLEFIDYKACIVAVNKMLKLKESSNLEKKKLKEFEKLADESSDPVIRLKKDEIFKYVVDPVNHIAIGEFAPLGITLYELKGVPTVHLLANDKTDNNTVFLVKGRFVNPYHSDLIDEVASIRRKFIEKLMLGSTNHENVEEEGEEDEEEIIE